MWIRSTSNARRTRGDLSLASAPRNRLLGSHSPGQFAFCQIGSVSFGIHPCLSPLAKEANHSFFCLEPATTVHGNYALYLTTELAQQNQRTNDVLHNYCTAAAGRLS